MKYSKQREFLKWFQENTTDFESVDHSELIDYLVQTLEMSHTKVSEYYTRAIRPHFACTNPAPIIKSRTNFYKVHDEHGCSVYAARASYLLNFRKPASHAVLPKHYSEIVRQLERGSSMQRVRRNLGHVKVSDAAKIQAIHRIQGHTSDSQIQFRAQRYANQMIPRDASEKEILRLQAQDYSTEYISDTLQIPFFELREYLEHI